MNFTRLLKMATAAAVLASAVGAAETLEIKAKDGKTIRAEVISADDDSVLILRDDGKEFDLPFERIDDESAKAIRELLAARKKAEEAANVPDIDIIVEPGFGQKEPEEEPKSPKEVTEKVVVTRDSTVIVTFTVNGDRLTKPVIVEKQPESGPFIRIKLAVEEGELKLDITSTYEKAVLVNCFAKEKGSDEYSNTSIPPLDQDTLVSEGQPETLEELVLYRFRFEPEF